MTDLSGEAINQIVAGQSFELRVFVQDIRESPQGILSAYVDIEYDDSLVRPIEDSIEHGSQFGEVARAEFVSQMITDAGSFAAGQLGAPPLPDPVAIEDTLLFSTRFEALTVGTAHFTSNAADTLPLSATTLRGINGAVPQADMLFGTASLTITPIPEPSSYSLALLGAAVVLLRRRILCPRAV